MKTIHYPNTIRFHLVTIVPMAPFTPKSTSKLRSALHSRYSIVIPRFISHVNTVNPNNHYNHGFHNTFDYNHYGYSDLGYEPADLTVHPPPRTAEGGFIFFV